MTMMRLLELSTGHLTRATRDWLNEDIKIEMDHSGHKPAHRYLITSSFCAVHAFPFDEGWFLLCCETAALSKRTPSDLLAVIRFADKLGADWIKLDADGLQYDQLPFYDED